MHDGLRPRGGTQCVEVRETHRSVRAAQTAEGGRAGQLVLTDPADEAQEVDVAARHETLTSSHEQILTSAEHIVN